MCGGEESEEVSAGWRKDVEDVKSVKYKYFLSASHISVALH